jgi:hypothetical protein
MLITLMMCGHLNIDTGWVIACVVEIKIAIEMETA